MNNMHRPEMRRDPSDFSSEKIFNIIYARASRHLSSEQMDRLRHVVETDEHFRRRGAALLEKEYRHDTGDAQILADEIIRDMDALDEPYKN